MILGDGDFRMKATIYVKTESHGKGCPEDGSESWETTEEFFLITEDNYEEFGEHQASCYGDQDYSYRVKFESLFECDMEDMAKVRKLLNTNENIKTMREALTGESQ